MGFVGLLQFSLKCFDVLAWPLVALVYPLCASVRAIETNSNYHMRKLVTYWVLFSLISLFELAFVRVIEWLPFWPQIKLIFVCCLVIPRFNGAYYVYKSLVHMCLSVDLQAVVKWLNKPKDEVSLKPETFLAVAETYVQKNGTEGLEKLIASKSKDSNSNLIVEEIKSVANAEKKEVATTIQFNEPNIVQKDVKTVEPKEKNAAAAAAAVKSPKDSNSILFLEEIKSVANVEEKEVATTIQCNEPNIVQKDVKTLEPNEKNAAAAAAAAVKSCKEPNIAQKDVKAVESPEKNAVAAAKRTEKKAVAAVEVKEMTEPAACKEDKLPEPPASKKVQKEWTCAVCQVTTTCEANLKKHLLGLKHRATLDELKASKQAGKKSNSEQFNQRNTNTSNAGTKLSKLWCSICDIRCPGEIHMAAHLNGSKHLSRIKEMFDLCGGEKGWECGICNVRCSAESVMVGHLNVRCSAESVMVGHLNGKMHFSRVEQMLNPVGGQPGFCSICNVRCSGEIDMAAHLNGGKHLSRIQEMINPLVVANKDGIKVVA